MTNPKTSYYNISERKVLLRFVDIILLILSLFIASIYLEFNYITFYNPNSIYWLLLLTFYYILFGEIFQLYNLNVSNNRYLIVRSVVLTAFVTTVFYIFTPFLSPSLPLNRLQIVYFFLVLSVPIVVWRFLYMWLIFSPKYFKSVVFIGKSDRIKKMILQIKDDNIHHVNAYISDQEIPGVKGFININSVKLLEIISKEFVSEVIVSKEDLSNDEIKIINKDLIHLFENGVNIISFENFYENVTARVPREYLNYDFFKYINFSKNSNSKLYLLGLRVLDLMVSIIGLLLFFILLPFLLIGNLFGNKGKLFYSQERVGINGKIFKIYKLRSMVKNAEKEGAVWAAKNDARITSFGKFLRNTRLDEFPQFYNILKGDMSLIGPRPERPEFVETLETEIPFYAIRHVVRPGLTGWAQVNYPYANTLEEQETKLRYDLYYNKERNGFLDFKILIKTITTVLFFKGQ
ncbi:exopolysaccharide biosynthesis polyprenyl glycosylphosphotransferase [Polaribacter sp. MSW13]|uniref:Exopolysaccharide biosynthesis polyprenyl glycosylphosphotransferase n=1 Tax=Polaribacter marinus TaxID=2916838 RepID=A0A9X2AM01_9FLAO|nr:exopolysaccharide biosynthesis polyprenyl glycosylphosphotransferase [Polaribacter marinus]MCI2228404.1 exopolysaccharide biosynthesis polyprenyl glycosylphosphotransferase [Polaribacter marinus]